MTCKISFIKSIRETLKHHLAAIFITSIVFFIQLIVFFLNIQNIASLQILSSGPILNYDNLIEMTLPGASYTIPVIFCALLLGFDFFRYLHSKKQSDFYDSLPMQRKEWYVLRMTSAFLVFLIPYLLCTGFEMLLLVVYDFSRPELFINLMWNALCMVLIFLINCLTASLAMILTGNSVIAIFAYCIFSAYAPLLLRYIYPSYAYEYFKTYVTEDGILQNLEYFSPIGLTYRLLNSNYLEWTAKAHLADFLILIASICITALLSFYLFLKRPSEAAGRAMAFEKWNPIIRILLVIPITLYIGLYLSQITFSNQKGWMIFGFLISTVLLHGIIESVFQFDIRGMKSHKSQIVLCFVICAGIAIIFWNDLLGYDKYVPELDELESISIRISEYYHYTQTDDGIGSDNWETALQLAQNLIEQNSEEGDGNEWISFTYRLKNGNVKQREYYMDFEANEALMNKLYATSNFKDDFCPLYKQDIKEVHYISWSDSVSTVQLLMSQEELELLFETYMAEYTPFTYSEKKSELPIGFFIVCLDEEYDYLNYECYVFPEFTQTISIIEKYMANNPSTKDYGKLSESPLEKYEINSIEIYYDDSTQSVTDYDTIQMLKDYLVPTDYFYQTNSSYEWENYYETYVNFIVNDGFGYSSYMISREIADNLNE